MLSSHNPLKLKAICVYTGRMKNTINACTLIGKTLGVINLVAVNANAYGGDISSDPTLCHT